METKVIMMERMMVVTRYGVFWLYSTISALGLLFCILLVPRTLAPEPALAPALALALAPEA